MKKLLYIFLILFFIPFKVFASPPITGGVITSPFGPRDVGERASTFHKGVDIYVPSGTPIIAPAKGRVNHGAGNGYIYWTEITLDDGSYYLFGDCSSDTLMCQSGYVSEGTIIGYTGGDAYDGPLGYSTGPHVHIEYSPLGEFGSRVDPVPFLKALGMDLSVETISPSDNGHDNINLPWGIEGMYELGENIQDIMKQVVEAAGRGFNFLQNACYALLLVLCIIDLTIPIMTSGMTISMQFIITKIVKYGFLMFIMLNWQTIINDLFLSFVTSVSTTFTNNPHIGDDVSQPQMILQKAIFMVTPALNKIASFGSWDFYTNLSTIIPIYLATFITIGVFFVFACYIMLIYIEFYVVAALSICTFPFSAFGFTKFIAEGSLGHIVSSTIKLTIISIMVSFCVICIRDADPGNIFTVQTPSTQAIGTGTITGPPNLVALATKKAQKYGIPVSLFLAQIQLESSWNPNAISQAGAQGLGQLMPGTAEGLGCSDPFNPEQNLEAAAKYMKQLHDIYDDWNYSLAAYNGGPGNITAGEPLPGWAKEYIDLVNANLSGSYTINNGINSEAMIKFILMCLSLIGLAFLTARIPTSLLKILGGKYELS